MIQGSRLDASGNLIEDEINGGDTAVPGNDEISSGVGRCLAGMSKDVKQNSRSRIDACLHNSMQPERFLPAPHTVIPALIFRLLTAACHPLGI